MYSRTHFKRIEFCMISISVHLNCNCWTVWICGLYMICKTYYSAFKHIYGFMLSIKEIKLAHWFNWISIVNHTQWIRICVSRHTIYNIKSIFCLFCLNLTHSQPHFILFATHFSRRTHIYQSNSNNNKIKIGTRKLKHPISAIDPLLL